MNYLAHALLGSPDLITGSALGDFVKGPVPDHLPEGIHRGVKLHRRVDALTARLPAMTRGFEVFPRAVRRYAPVLVDLIADHFLARDFERFAGRSLADFEAEASEVLVREAGHLGEDARRFAAYVARSHLFARFRDESTVEDAMSRIGERVRRPDLAALAMAGFRDARGALARDFDAYFPVLAQQARTWTLVTAAR